MKKLLKALLKLAVGLVLVVCILLVSVWGRELKTICSVRPVDVESTDPSDTTVHPMVFKMDYTAPYDLDAVAEADIDDNKKLVQFVITKLSKGLYSPEVKVAGQTFTEKDTTSFACTSFQAKNAEGEGYLFGRNYDFFKKPILVVESHPKNGYASISACDMGHFGYGVDKLPDSFAKKAMCIASIYAPMDGINEKGFCISIMALPKQASRQSTGKHVVGTTIIMRMALDRCATVQEAIDLFATYDVRHDATAGAGYHYMVADASGDCAVIEFDKEDQWKTMIVRKDADSTWMHVTNHLLSPKYYTTEPDPSVGNPKSFSWWRYATVSEYLGTRGGILTPEEGQECLAKVHWKDLVQEGGLVEDTVYSNLYDQQNLTMKMRPWNDYDKTLTFTLSK